MSSDLFAFADFLAKNYKPSVSEEKKETVIGVNVKSESLKVSSGARKSKAVVPFQHPPKVESTALTAAKGRIIVESVDAKGFKDLLRNAGMRNGKRDFNLVDADKKVAIERYVGYSYGVPFGTQLDNAERKANAELRPSGPMKSKVGQSVRGYVAGLPSDKDKRRSDLEGRLVLAQNTLVENLAGRLTSEQKSHLSGGYLSGGYNEKELAGKYAKLEEARVSKIEKDLVAIR